MACGSSCPTVKVQGSTAYINWLHKQLPEPIPQRICQYYRNLRVRYGRVLGEDIGLGDGVQYRTKCNSHGR
jgi:hypothetical protein